MGFGLIERLFILVFNHHRFLFAALSTFDEKNVEEAIYTFAQEEKHDRDALKAAEVVGKRRGFDDGQEFLNYIAQRRNFYLNKH